MNQNPGSIRDFIRPKTVNPTVFWRLAEDIPPRLSTTLTIVSIALPLLLWWLVTTFGQVDPKFLPSPAQVLAAFGRLWSTRELLKDTVASYGELVLGFSWQHYFQFQ
jgi:NitT/TauT family transport system permease protein